VARERRHRAPWYTTKTCPSYADMIGKLRRVRIAAQYLPEVPHQPTPDEIRAVHLAWAQAAAYRESQGSDSVGEVAGVYIG
jgi:hypothetical protein